MRWLAIKRKDGEADLYAIAFCTHTVSKAIVNGKPTFEAWRLNAGAASSLGNFRNAELAKLAVENDARIE